MNNQALKNAYLKNSVDTASSGQLLIMLYDGAIRYTKLAIEATNNNNIQEAHNSNIRVQDIIDELMVTLNYDYEISKNLFSLYDYFKHLLIQANLKKDTAPLEEVLGYVMELRQTWLVAAKRVRENG